MREQIEKHFMKYGITVRIVIYFTVLVIVPFFLLAVMIVLVFQNYAVSSLGETTEDAMAVVGTQIADSMREREEDSMIFYYNGCVELLSSGRPLMEEERIQIEEELAAASYSDTGMRAAYIETNDQVLSGGNFPELVSLMEPYKEQIVEAKGACCWYATDQLHGKANENMYVLARSLNSSDRKTVGILYMILDGRMVKDAFSQMKSSYSTRYLTDEKGQILYSSNEEMFNKTLDISMIDPKLRGDYQTIQAGDHKKQIMVSYRLMDSGWYCISTIATKDILRSTRQLIVPFLCISAVYIIFLFVMLSMMRKYVFRPLSMLKNNMDQYAKESIENADMEPIGIGEFQSLSVHFNSMNHRIYNLMQDYKEEVDEKNRQKMKALTSQLTPHFIYNALNTIKWTAVLNHQENIQNMTESLIYILMNAARAEEDHYTIEDELQLIQNYAVIQKARFMNFDLSVEKDASCEGCRIRKFLVQPIVENAIVHGLGRGKVQNSIITVKVWADEELHIVVKDNGVGFDVGQWRKNPKKDEEHTNIGIASIEQIIQLEHGESYGIQIESTPGAGTTVKYRLPIIREGR